MQSDEIMALKVGQALNEKVEVTLQEYVSIDYGCTSEKQVSPWSEEDGDALELWEMIGDTAPVGIARLGDGPALISMMASIGDDEDGRVTVYVGDWREALCKAFLLYHHGHYGDYMNSEWERAMKEAPKRVLQ